MTDLSKVVRFEELMELLSNREWRTAEGEETAIEDMSESHIKNTIRLIKEKEINLCGLEDEYVEMFEEELEDRSGELDFD